MRGLSAILLILLLAGCATPQQKQRKTPLVWNAESLARATGKEVRLLAKGQSTPVATVDVQRVRLLVDATRRAERVAGITATVHLAESSQPNAFVVTDKDGAHRIVFTLGMLDMLQDDQDAYAAVVGHELAHVTLGHRATRQQREQTRIVLGTIAAVALGAAGVPAGGTIADLASQSVSTVFSREEERDADRYGIHYSMQAGFDPQGAVRVWEKMAARGSGPGVSFLSSHPVATERLEALREIAAGKQPVPAAALASTRFERLRPLGALSAGEALPAGDLYLDVNTISSNNRPNSKRAWLVLNTAQPREERSQKVHVIANCAIQSLSVVETVLAAAPDGAGGELGRSDRIHVFGDAELAPPLAAALKMMCER